MRRWHIPAVFMMLIGGLIAVVAIGAGHVVAESEAGIAADRPFTATPIELSGGTTYNFEATPQAMCKGCKSTVRIELFRDTDEVLSLDSTFDANADGATTLVTLDFEAPTDGLYQPRFSLISSNGGGERLAWKVTRKPLLPLESWPLVIGLLLFLTLTAWTWASSDAELLEALSKLGAGTRLNVAGQTGTIQTVTEFREQGYAPGIEYEIRMDDGSIRYVAIDRFEEDEWDDAAGYERHAVYHVAMLSQPLGPAALDELAAQEGELALQLMGDIWRVDDNNSGEVHSVIYKVGSVFQSVQDVRVYRRNDISFPKNPGHRWLEHIDYRDGDTEWALMEIIAPSDVEVIEAVEHESVPDLKLHELDMMRREARAARDRRDAAANSQSPQQQQQQQQQQWAQKPFGDGHG